MPGVWLAAFRDILLADIPTRVVIRFFTRGNIVDGSPLVEQESLCAAQYFVGWFGPVPDPADAAIEKEAKTLP